MKECEAAQHIEFPGLQHALARQQHAGGGNGREVIGTLLPVLSIWQLNAGRAYRHRIRSRRIIATGMSGRSLHARMARG
jgi:hypothetical protein